MRNDSAFTFIELLLSLLILSVIGVSLYTVFNSGIKLSETLKNEGQFYQEAQWIFQQMSRDLEQALFYDYAGSYPDKKSFLGSPDKISFIRDSPGGLKVVRYYLEPPGQGHIHKVLIGKKYSKNRPVFLKEEVSSGVYYLIREEQPIVGYWQEREDTREAEVLSMSIPVDGLKFLYVAPRTDATKSLSVQAQWEDLFLPAQIEIALSFGVRDSASGMVNFNKIVSLPKSIYVKDIAKIATEKEK